MADTAAPPEYDLAYAILRLAADPVKCKQRLDELVAREVEIKELIATLDEARAGHEKARVSALSASASADAAQQIIDTRDAESRQKAGELAKREAECADRETATAAKINDADARQCALADDLATRQSAIDAAAKDIAERQAALAAGEADYQQRVAQFKKLAGIGD